MAYDIDSIKQRNPIADVISARGVALRESGVGRCPFHEDEHPSFAVYPETRSPAYRSARFYCFGCNAGGDKSPVLHRRSFQRSATRPFEMHCALRYDCNQ